jgi:hypothetical protein
MRTTITVEDDVAASLKRLGKRRGLRFKSLVNQSTARGHKVHERTHQEANRFSDPVSRPWLMPDGERGQCCRSARRSRR